MKLVLCEGEDDLAVIRGLCQARHLIGLTVEHFGGRNNLENVVRELPKRPEFVRQEVDSLAVTLDAEQSQDSSWQKVRETIRVGFGVTLPQQREFAGEKPKVAGFIVSRPDGTGMLEDLCLAAVSNQPGYQCLDDYFRCLAERTTRKEYHPKAKFRAWMASQTDFDLRVGKAAVEGYLPWDSPAFDSLAQFLATL